MPHVANRSWTGSDALRLARPLVLALLAGGSGVGLSGCSSEPPPRITPVQSDLPPTPPAMRGLIGTEVSFRNVNATLVSGFGLVVGLNGTGGLTLNDAIASTMERQMALQGMTSESEALRGTPLEGKSPGEILRDPNVAVVAVTAAVAPGLPEGTTFDVQLDAVNATSLEGGQLWNTELRFGVPATFGQAQTTKVGEARGPVFVDPFAPGGPGAGMASGRVLGGGTVTRSLKIILALNSPSHARARAMVSAINSRFPASAGDEGPIAQGKSDSTIEVSVPERMRDEAPQFLQLIRHLQIDQSNPQAYARRYVDAIRNEPELADQLSWALEALGERAIPLIRELYDATDLAPRLAGLKAGARLNDARVTSFLKELAQTGQGTVRTQAIALLAEVDAGPSVDVALRDLLSENDLLVRVAAYEGLAQRAERARFNALTRMQRDNPELRGQRMSPAQLLAIARFNLPPGTIQGVSREPVEDKFLLDRVKGGEPMIYHTQQGVPRVVIFGEDDKIAFSGVANGGVSVWEGRLMLTDDDRAGLARARLLKRAREGAGNVAIVHTMPATLEGIITTLARRTSPNDPRPGFDLSYSEVVAALARLQEAGATPATFATERDRLAGLLLAAEASRNLADRPETETDEPVIIRRGGLIAAPKVTGEQDKPTIVPIEPPPKK